LIRKWLKRYGETNKQDSMTVPGESYTIQQLFDRANAGVPLDVSVNVNEGYYANPEDFEDFAPHPGLDRVDYENIIEQSRQVIESAKAVLSSLEKTPPEAEGEATQEQTTPAEGEGQPESKSS